MGEQGGGTDPDHLKGELLWGERGEKIHLTEIRAVPMGLADTGRGIAPLHQEYSLSARFGYK